MHGFFETLKRENSALFWFGAFNLGAAVAFSALSQLLRIELVGVNAWFKPLKFSLSIAIYAWAMAWYCRYLPASEFNLKLFNLVTIVTLGFEIVYIGLQASRGQLSHFNQSTPAYSFLYIMMALAASLATLGAAYAGFFFFTKEFPDLPAYYLWGIRLGILIFVVFSFEGFLMGSRLSHTIGGSDGGPGLPFLNWSTQFGDPRVAHFVGMHALQVIPFVSFYLLKDTKLTLLVGFAYFCVALLTLIQALAGHPALRV